MSCYNVMIRKDSQETLRTKLGTPTHHRSSSHFQCSESAVGWILASERDRVRFQRHSGRRNIQWVNYHPRNSIDRSSGKQKDVQFNEFWESSLMKIDLEFNFDPKSLFQKHIWNKFQDRNSEHWSISKVPSSHPSTTCLRCSKVLSCYFSSV